MSDRPITSAVNVIVVGIGAADIAAANSAFDAGSSVTVLERTFENGDLGHRILSSDGSRIPRHYASGDPSSTCHWLLSGGTAFADELALEKIAGREAAAETAMKFSDV